MVAPLKYPSQMFRAECLECPAFMFNDEEDAVANYARTHIKSERHQMLLAIRNNVLATHPVKQRR